MKLRSTGFKTEVSIANHSGVVEPAIDISIDLMKRYVGFGSHNLIEATIKNRKDYYQSFDVILANTQGLITIGENKKHVLLKPKSEKIVYWIVKTDSLKKGFEYTFPILVYSVGDIRASSQFGALDGGAQISLKRAEKTIGVLDYNGQKKYTRDTKLVCRPSQKFYYIDELGSITCALTNSGNVMLQHVKICIDDECEFHSIGITQQSVIIDKFDELVMIVICSILLVIEEL